MDYSTNLGLYHEQQRLELNVKCLPIPRYSRSCIACVDTEEGCLLAVLSHGLGFSFIGHLARCQLVLNILGFLYHAHSIADAGHREVSRSAPYFLPKRVVITYRISPHCSVQSNARLEGPIRTFVLMLLRSQAGQALSHAQLESNPFVLLLLLRSLASGKKKVRWPRSSQYVIL